MARYAKVEAGVITGIFESSPEFAAEQGWVPAGDANVGWTSDGTTHTPGVPPTPVPQSVTMRQGRLALLAIGKLDDVDAAINAMPEPQQSQSRIEWEYASTLDRNNPLVLSLGPALGLTESDIDNLFIEAAKL
jgi:hypothetical protein